MSVHKPFVAAVEQRDVASWPIRAACLGSKSITTVLYVIKFPVPDDADQDALATQTQATYTAALELYEAEDYSGHWQKLRELPFPITWDDGVDLKDAILQFLARSTTDPNKKELVVFYHKSPSLSYTQLCKIVPDMNCMGSMPLGAGLKLASRAVQLLLAHAGGDCYMTRVVVPQSNRRDKADTKAPRILAEAAAAYMDRTLDAKLPGFLDELKAGFCTSDDRCSRWETVEKHKWATVLRNAGRKLRDVPSCLANVERYPWQDAFDAKAIEPLVPGERPLLWVACPTNRSGKTEAANDSSVRDPDGLGPMTLHPPFGLKDAYFQYKEAGEPGYVFIDIPMESTDMEREGFAEFIESLNNLGARPNVTKYIGGKVTLRAKLIVLSNRLPLVHMRGRDIQLLVLPGKHDDEGDDAYKARLRAWQGFEWRQFGMKKLVGGKRVSGVEDEWVDRTLAELAGEASVGEPDFDAMRPRDVRNEAKRMHTELRLALAEREDVQQQLLAERHAGVMFAVSAAAALLDTPKRRRLKDDLGLDEAPGDPRWWQNRRPCCVFIG